MSLQKYDQYKSCNCDLASQIPSHWDVVALKRLARLKSGDTITSESIEEEGEHPVFGGNGKRGFTNAFTHNGNFPLIGRQGAHCGNINYSSGKFWASEHAVVVTPTKGLNVKWLGETLRAMNLNQYSVSAAQPGLSVDAISKLSTPLPPEIEQKSIASFLDHETAKIDALITEQERLIELLQEKRQAVISHAVTKGLNPNAPMKDSGVEWLGEVPEHWLITPLKYLVTMKSGGTPSKSNLEFWDGGNIPWASSKDLKTDKLEDTQDHITQQAIIEGAVQIQIKESVFICVRGMILAHTFPVVEPKQEMAINQDLKCLIPKKELNHEYLAILLRGLSKEILGRVDEAAHGTKVLRIPDFSSLLVPVPPHEEQERIHKDIGVSNRQFERLQAHCTNSIQLLQERRSALISAAVTGQIDVRGLDPEEESA